MNADEPAFPIAVVNANGDMQASPGLTKREYFAALAMQGLVSRMTYEIAVINAVGAADALIAELAKPKEQK